jgi:hypothetical protein
MEKGRHAVEMTPEIIFVERVEDIFDPSKMLKSTRVVDIRPHID